MTLYELIRTIGVPVILAGISGYVLIISARLTRKSSREVNTTDERKYELDVIKTRLESMQWESDQTYSRLRTLQEDLNEERERSFEYRRKVDNFEHERGKARRALEGLLRHVRVLERWIEDRRGPPPPALPDEVTGVEALLRKGNN